MTSLVKEIEGAIKNWWIFLVLGVLFVLGSFYVFSTPMASFIGLSIFFAIFMLMDGFSSIAAAVTNQGRLEGWGWQLAGGILSTLIGVGLMIRPQVSMAVLPLFVGFWILLRGSLMIGTSFDLKKMGVKDWGWAMGLGVVNVILGIYVLGNPIFGATILVITIGIAMLFQGMFFILVALRLRKVKRKFGALKEGAQEKIGEIKASIAQYVEEKPEDTQAAFRMLKDKLEDAFPGK